MFFIKSTPGGACKLAEVLNAYWTQKRNSLVKEAVALDGTVIAYSDCHGWFIAKAYANVDTSGVMA